MSRIQVYGTHSGTAGTGTWHREQSPPGVSAWLKRLPDLVHRKLSILSLISAEQDSYAIVNAATIPRANAEVGGGRYFNRIWRAESMSQCLDSQARLLMWEGALDGLRPYNQELVPGLPIVE